MRSKSKERGLKYSNVKSMVEKRSASFSAPYLKLPEGAKLFKPKAGIMLLDILPYEAGEGNPWAEEGVMHWERTFWVHRGVGANSESFLCPRKTSKSKCPICEMRARLQQKGDEENEDLIQSLAPKERQLFNVINRKEPDKGVQLWDFSYHMFGKLLQARLRDADDEDGWNLFFSLDEGLTLKVGFGEKSYSGRAYFEAETIDFKPRPEPYEESILDEVYNLDSILIESDYEELKKAFLESSEDVPGSSKRKRTEEEEEEEEEKPRKRREEAEDEPEEKPRRRREEPEDEDEKPRKRREEPEEEDEKPKKKSKDADEEFDDFKDFEEEDEKPKKKDEEEEDEKPRRRREEPEEEEEKPRKRREEPEDEEEKPRKRRPEPEEEEERPRRRRPDPEEEEEKPRIKTRDEELEELEDEKPKKKSKDADEEDPWDEDRDEKPRKRK